MWPQTREGTDRTVANEQRLLMMTFALEGDVRFQSDRAGNHDEIVARIRNLGEVLYQQDALYSTAFLWTTKSDKEVYVALHPLFRAADHWLAVEITGARPFGDCAGLGIPGGGLEDFLRKASSQGH